MKWSEVRNLYPSSFVKLEILESHIQNEKEYVDEVALIKLIPDNKEALKEFNRCKDKEIVYNTKNKEFVIDIIKHIGIRRGL
ncbi:hypothetical protein IC213_18360 [Clostridioides sp. ES-S-0049-02]|uniref:hypothetical protein n=1 Tax=Clostridioides sp. ES-S-0049-02 TaxID=2770778 RepID=UPI001CA4DAB0|nr:hypothetical protein [Clostridioides sp. ES-S-0049-02]MDI0267294.1 hypothetical protein [Clostridioides difficile]